ncbi:hypothetical protein RhiirC2_724806, partial [Rhizophagus irregularis]
MNITDNPSVFKAELVAMVMLLLVCPKNASVKIHVDAQVIINMFNQIQSYSLQQIVKTRRPYNIWWILCFKII